LIVDWATSAKEKIYFSSFSLWTRELLISEPSREHQARPIRTPQESITFLSPLQGSPSSTVASRVTSQSYFLLQYMSYQVNNGFYSVFNSDLNVSSLKILEKFSLNWTRIQRGVHLGCWWMLVDVVFPVQKGSLARP
jgi:hypothetical protein